MSMLHTPGALFAPARSFHGVLRKIMSELKSNEERGRTGRAALTAFAIRVASAGIAYLSQVLLARWMGSSEYGIFVWVWVWVLILGGLSSLGLNIALMRFVPEHQERGEIAELRGVLVNSRLVTLGVSSTVMALGLLGLHLLGDRLTGAYVLPLYLALFCVPLYTLTDLQDGIGRSFSWIGLGLLPPYVLRPLLILLAMLAARALDFPMTAATAAGSAIIATWAAGLVQLGLIERRLARHIPAGERRYETKAWLATSLPICFISACELVLQNADVLVLSQFASPSEVGIYFAALKTISLISFVHYAVGSAIASRLSALNARGDRAGLARAIHDGASWTFWPSLAGAVLLLLLGKPLLAMFGPEFSAGYPATFLLATGLLLRASVGPAEYVLRMLGEQRLCAIILGVTALVDVALNLALVPPFGMTGAAAANALSLILAAILFHSTAQRRLGIDISVWAALRRPPAPASPAA